MIRRFRKEDIKDLAELASSVLGPTSERLLHWLFIDNPFLPKGKTNLVLEEDSKIVGMAFNVYVKLKFYDRTLDARWACFFVTSPDYRGSGIELAEQYIQIPYYPFLAFSTKKHFMMESRFGFKKIFDICSYISIIDFKKLFRFKLGKNLFLERIGEFLNRLLGLGSKICAERMPKGLNFEEITYFDERFNDLWRRCSPYYQILVKRDKDYLNWRFTRSPSQYRIIALVDDTKVYGYIVISVNEKNGLKKGAILDLLAANDNKTAVIDALLSEALRYFRKEGCYSADFLILTAKKEYLKPMRKHGFLFKRLRSTFVVYKKCGGDIKGLRNWKNWFVTRSDPDLELCD
ncbi:MAG: GNAT family N-acetyltransferase [Candidatus Omnitrophota bacterium]|jgi:GNAT superfamily N-acetyltransferase|nr:MAG: GNAT family N-acetyltransferase [Candidatus Omnitrophota bacterium]